MDKLVPFEVLEDDYYVGEVGRQAASDGESRFGLSLAKTCSSDDDALKTQFRRIAGIPTCAEQKQQVESEFEKEMESDLDDSICEYTKKHLGGSNQDLSQAADGMEEQPGTSAAALPRKKLTKKKVRISEDVQMKSDDEDGVEQNPIKSATKAAKKKRAEEQPDFYDSDEDDDNERWIAEHRRLMKGGEDDSEKMAKLSEKQRRSKIDDGSDAVLSCPGCMSLITRDCQRHELYKNQYRAMFVENVEIEDDVMTVEESGKDARNKRRKARKSTSQMCNSAADIFYPVRCAVCKTSVGVVDLEEVYHFFNVLSGYA